MLRSEFLNDNLIRGNGELTIPTEYNVTDYVLNNVPNGVKKDDMEKEAVIDVVSGDRLTHREFRHQIIQLASGLINNYHLKRGDVVALFSPNHIHFPSVLLAALSVGIIVTTVNSNYTAKEVSYQLDHSKAKLIIAYHEIANVAKEAIDQLNITIPIISIDYTDNPITEPFHSLLSDRPYEKLIFKEGECQETDAIMIYSSGTTGVPKGIINTHYNIIASMCQAQPYLFKDNQDTKYLMGNTPFYHSYGMALPLLNGIHRHITLLPMKKFIPTLFLKTIQDYQLDYIIATPPMSLFLAKQPIVDEYNLSSLKKILCGGSTLPLEVCEKLINRLGCKVEQGYGMTEASPFLTLGDADKMPLDAVGRLLPNITAKVIHPETREILPIGEKGELWVRGPNNMKGYLNNVKANRATFDNEGYMCTGDIAYFDNELYLHIFDRSSDLIKHHHHRTSPSYLESLILAHFPSILDCCVIGIDFSPTEQYPRAYLVLNPTISSSPTLLEEIEIEIHNKLEPHQYFKGGWIVVDEIMKSPAGKILRRVMKDRTVIDDNTVVRGL